MRVVVDSVIRVRQPEESVINWCDKNLVLNNPEYAKKQRMGLWLGQTPKTICLYEKHGDELQIPTGCLMDMIGVLRAFNICDPHALKVVHFGGTPMPLYDYQREAVDEMLLSYGGILQAPAGSGKTFMGIALAKELKRKTLWITHTKDLLMQAKKTALQYVDNSGIGTITEGKIDIGSIITFATIQTLANIDLEKYRNEWGCIIVDECHRMAGSPTQVTRYFKVLTALSARLKYGLSATVHRADGLIKSTYALIGKVQYTVTQDQVDDKIMPVAIQPILINPQVDELKYLNTDGTINYTRMISQLCFSVGRNSTITKILLHEGYGHSCLILSDRVMQLQKQAAKFPNSAFVDGSTPKKEREQALDDMRSGKKTMLFASYALAKEGLDIPCLDRLFLLSPQKDYAIVTQSIGRVARTAEGKTDAYAFDLVDNTRYGRRAFKERCRTYRKLNCKITEMNEAYYE